MKKLLIISSWAPPMPGGPQSLYNLFSQFPKESYAVLTSGRNIEASQRGKVMGNWLSGKYYYYDHAPLNTSQKNSGAPGVTGQQGSLKQTLTKGVKALPVIGIPLYYTIATCYVIFSFSRSAIKAARESNAELLMGVSDKGPALIATWLASWRLKKPYVLYLYDLYRGNNLTHLDAFLANILERFILKKAKKVILTNEGAENYYRRRYGPSIATAVVHNSTFIEAYEKIRKPYDPRPPYRIVFTGHVDWPQEGSIINIIEAMKRVRDLPVVLELYIPAPTTQLQAAIAEQPNITLSSAHPEDIPRIQNNATLLYLPLSWDTRAPDIIATATPGKFTDYLASGRPMLIHAPDYAYVSRYARKKNLGLVVDTNDVTRLTGTIRDFITNPQVGKEFIKNALNIFYQNHDARKNAKKIIELFTMV